MAYNPYAAVNAIYNLKGQWTAADKSGDTKKKKAAEDVAKTYYDELRIKGYGDIADSLSGANYADAKRINDAWAKYNKTNGTDYIKTLGKSYGLNDSELTGLLSYDGITGQMSLGGNVIGTPDAMVDGVSYWSDTAKLDDAFNNYINKSGTVRSNNAMISQENQKLFERLAGEYEDLKNENPFETEVGKSILSKYDLSALQGRENAMASEAGSNGGNIDSFAAANALRQQTAIVNQGRDAALAAHQQRIDNARALLSDMGVHIDRVYNQDETSKNNQVARDVSVSEVTGVVPDSMTYKNNPYFNSDGTLAAAYNTAEFDANGGFQRIINDATEKLKTTTDANERANLEATINYANQARNYKIKNSPAHGQWAHTVVATAPTATAPYRISQAELDNAVKINDANNAATEKLTQMEINAQKQMNAADNASAEIIAGMKNANESNYQTAYDEAYKTVSKSTPEDRDEAKQTAYNNLLIRYNSGLLTLDEVEAIVSALGLWS